jgi:integrase/recombinase XerD
LSFNEIKEADYESRLLGHARVDTTALYAQVATNVIRAVMSPLDRLTPLTPENKPPA